MVAEAVTVLQRGLPGGPVTLLLGLTVVLVGTISYAKQSATVLSVFLLPAAITGGLALVIGHNLWPRLFFFSTGFASLILMRGLFVLGRALSPWKRTSSVLGSLVVLASATTVPRAWAPKQDFRSAVSFVEEVRAPTDAVVTVDYMTDLPFLEYLGQPWKSVDSEENLRKVERTHSRTWAIYAFPTRVAAIHPAIWARLQAEYGKRAVFPGTVRGGDIVVMVKE